MSENESSIPSIEIMNVYDLLTHFLMSDCIYKLHIEHIDNQCSCNKL